MSSNSIVGISSNPANEVSYILCSDGVMELATIQSNPFNSTKREFTPGLAASFVMGKELDEGDDNIGTIASSAQDSDEDAEDDNNIILSSMRINKASIVPIKIAELVTAAATKNRITNWSYWTFTTSASNPLELTLDKIHNPLIPPAVSITIAR